MLSGRRLDLLDPSPLDVEVEDIAHGLAFVARWNGQTRGEHAYSVAEHSLLVEAIFATIATGCEARWRMAALLHDAPEYVIGDMISPVKAAVGPGYAALDARLAQAVHIRFGLPADIPKLVKLQIKRADRISAWLEAVRIAGFGEAEADQAVRAAEARRRRVAGGAAPAAVRDAARVPRTPRRARGAGRRGGRAALTPRPKRIVGTVHVPRGRNGARCDRHAGGASAPGIPPWTGSPGSGRVGAEIGRNAAMPGPVTDRFEGDADLPRRSMSSSSAAASSAPRRRSSSPSAG